MCLIALIGVALPRFALFLMWLFTERLTVAFDSFILGFLGFLFLPYTTLFYALAYAPIGGVSGFGWFLVAFGFIVDITAHTNGGRAARKRRAVEA
jgi:hypothetical protein